MLYRRSLAVSCEQTNWCLLLQLTLHLCFWSELSHPWIWTCPLIQISVSVKNKIKQNKKKKKKKKKKQWQMCRSWWDGSCFMNHLIKIYNVYKNVLSCRVERVKPNEIIRFSDKSYQSPIFYMLGNCWTWAVTFPGLIQQTTHWW